MNKILGLVVGVAFLTAGFSAKAETVEREIVLRTMGGVAFGSNLGGSTAPALEVDVEAEVADSFAIGALFSFASFEASSPLPDSKLIHFALNPKYVVRKGAARFSFGAILGAQILSQETSVASSTITASQTSGALGVNANIDIPIWGVWNLSFSPSFIYGTASKAGQVSLMGGFGFRF